MSGPADACPGTRAGEDPPFRGPRREGTLSRSSSAYQRYRYLGRLLDGKFRAQEERVRSAQATLDAALARDEQALIEAGRRLRRYGHLNEEPSLPSLE